MIALLKIDYILYTVYFIYINIYLYIYILTIKYLYYLFIKVEAKNEYLKEKKGKKEWKSQIKKFDAESSSLFKTT